MTQNLNKFRLFVMASVLTVGVAACGEGTSEELDTGGGLDATTLDGLGGDGLTDDIADGDDVPDGATGLDGAGGDLTESRDGLFGEACQGNGDCVSGYCIAGYVGRVCSETCVNLCAEGWACRQDAAVATDGVFICVPLFPDLCRPCDTNSECNVGDPSGSSACIPRGDDGAFCGGGCLQNACPDGYECLTVGNIAGGSSLQCVPVDDAECACSTRAISQGAATTCRQGNDIGTCSGKRTCKAESLTSCDAPAAIAETCNKADDDCDGLTDEEGSSGCTQYLTDVDGDTYGRSGLAQCLCAPTGTYRATVGGDCDDDVFEVHPNASEACNDVDDDCDGFTDEVGAEGCETYYRDVDGDTYGVTADGRCLCDAVGAYRTQVVGDCNDGTTLIAPLADEYCNNVDDNCDGVTDEEGALGCRQFYVDGDSDTYGEGEGRCLCGPTAEFSASRGGDCDDGDSARNPGARERCDVDGADDNCNDVADEPNAVGCTDYFRDVDGDDFGVTATRLCLCAPSGEWRTTADGDCNDGSGAANPSVVETCNGIDDNCDGRFDEGCGMQVGGWPTAKYDHRRTNFGVAYTGPAGSASNVPAGSQRAAPAVRWQRSFGPTAFVSSPVFDLDGRLILVSGATIFKINAMTGEPIWQTTLPDVMSPAAAPTLREGGTIVVPTGNGLTMLNANGQILWDKRLPGLASEPITGAPAVDDNGVIYTVGFSAAYAIDSGGRTLWSVSVPNSQYVPTHVAWNRTNDRLYFGCSNHTLFALTRDGQIAWTYVVLAVDVDASTTIGGDGALYQTFGSTFHKVSDLGNRGVMAGTANGGNDMDTPVVLWADGSGVEHVLSNANSTSGLRSFRASDLVLEWTYAMTKDGSQNSTAAIDQRGRAFVGDDEGRFHAVNPDGTRQWVFPLAQTTRKIKNTVALQDGAVFFGDSAGVIYCLAE